MDIPIGLNNKQKAATRILTITTGALAIALAGGNIKVITVFALLTYYSLKNSIYVYSFVQTIGRDLTAGYRFVVFNIYAGYLDWKGWSVARIFRNVAARQPNKKAFVLNDHSLTFQEVEELSNQVGAYFKAQGLKHGDCVALILETCPEFPCLWLGLSKIGVITALINTNQRRDTLIHSLKVAQAKAIIVGTELADALTDIQNDEVVKALQIYQFSDNEQRENAIGLKRYYQVWATLV